MSTDPRFARALLDEEARAAGALLAGLAGTPHALVVLGSGLADALDQAWGEPAFAVSLGSIPGLVAPTATAASCGPMRAPAEPCWSRRDAPTCTRAEECAP